MIRHLIPVAACCVLSFAATQLNASTIAVLKTDTVPLQVDLAEQRLVSNSLVLLANRYNVDIAKSAVTQARAWYNPNIVYTQSLYDPASGTWLDNAPASGQVDVQVTELFSIAGRHINAVRLAEIDVQRTQLAFDELAASLKFEMYSDLATLYQAQQTDQLLSRELDALDQLIVAAQKEFSLGASAGNEVIRLKAERQTTLSDKLDNLSQIDQLEAGLRVLLGFPTTSWLKLSSLPSLTGNVPPLDSLLQYAMSRPDVQLAAADIQWNSRNLKLQRSYGVPDLMLGTEYDRRSSYTNNLWTVSAGIDIPIFNRNQGNIRAARYSLLQSQYQDSLTTGQAQSQVLSAYAQFTRIRTVRDSLHAQAGVISNVKGGDRGSYAKDLDMMFTNAVSNYSNRRINLIEFLDQLRTYDEGRRDLLLLESDYFISAQQLNYVTGTIVVR